MISKATKRFWDCYERLPADVQALARKRYRLWRVDPFHPSLHFKLIVADLWSARINPNYRALARRRGETIAWFWIGTHAEYDRLLR